MKIEELCIGNTVLHNGVEHKVYGLYSAEPNKEERFNNKPLVDLFDGSGICTALIDEIEGKMVTEEDLIRLGFVREETDEYLWENSLVYMVYEIRTNVLGMYGEWGKIVMYTHTLENLVRIFRNLSSL